MIASRTIVYREKGSSNARKDNKQSKMVKTKLEVPPEKNLVLFRFEVRKMEVTTYGNNK